jgi:hypothetical protein
MARKSWGDSFDTDSFSNISSHSFSRGALHCGRGTLRRPDTGTDLFGAHIDHTRIVGNPFVRNGTIDAGGE